MPTVTITHGIKCTVVKFRRTFFIQEDFSTGNIFWDADDQRSGIINVWLQQADTEPRIAGVSESWRVTINGVLLEQKFFEDIENLRGKEVRLSREDWAFTFDFTNQ